MRKKSSSTLKLKLIKIARLLPPNETPSSRYGVAAREETQDTVLPSALR